MDMWNTWFSWIMLVFVGFIVAGFIAMTISFIIGEIRSWRR